MLTTENKQEIGTRVWTAHLVCYWLGEEEIGSYQYEAIGELPGKRSHVLEGGGTFSTDNWLHGGLVGLVRLLTTAYEVGIKNIQICAPVGLYQILRLEDDRKGFSPAQHKLYDRIIKAHSYIDWFQGMQDKDTEERLYIKARNNIARRINEEDLETDPVGEEPHNDA